MTEMIFNSLAAMGFLHPLHPALTHVPMGMVMGAFFFALIAIVCKKDRFFITAHHCVGLGLVFIIPTVFTGYLDWQNTFAGEWDFHIICMMVLAVILTFLLLLAFTIGKEGNGKPKVFFLIVVLCLFCAVGLGYMGGDLVY